MKYRIKAYDIVNDIYILQRKFWFFWIATGSAGSKQKLEDWIADNEEE